MRRLITNVFGILWAPVFFIRFVLDHFNIYLKYFEYFDFLSIRVIYRLTRGRIIILYRILHSFLNSKSRLIKKRKNKVTKKQEFINKSIIENGFLILPFRLNVKKGVVNRYKTLGIYSDRSIYKSNKKINYRNINEAKADKKRLHTRFFYHTSDLIKDPDIWELISNKFFWDIAYDYLGQNFCLQTIYSWTLIPPTNYFLTRSQYIKGCLYSNQAQTFHYDLDWPIFLKIFICIDEANQNSGPFEYAIGTHKIKRNNLFQDKRISDDELKNEKIEYLIGPSGTVAIADTVGFHRDGRPQDSERTVLQIEFSSSAIGNPNTRTSFKENDLNKSTKYYVEKILDKYPRALRVIMK